MQNFFNKSANPSPTPLNEQYDDMKDNYQQIFAEAVESIRSAINAFKPVEPCKTCVIKGCNIGEKDVFTQYPSGCAYKEWQMQVISYLTGDYYQKLQTMLQEIMQQKNECECIKCGNCCRLATSEFSYDQLKQKAARGDKSAQDFVSVFVPYKTDAEAREANPEYFKLLEDTMEDERVYYYHCPKQLGNECTDYENRPDVCKNFPNNPLKLLPSSCSYNKWRKKVLRRTLYLKAKVDIIKFYKEQLG